MVGSDVESGDDVDDECVNMVKRMRFGRGGKGGEELLAQSCWK